MSKVDRDYYLARISAERDAAERAISDAARHVHLRLAEQYQEKLAGEPDKGPAPEER